MPYQVLLKEAHRLIDEMPEERLSFWVKTIQRKENKKVSAEEVNAFLDKHGNVEVDTAEASVLDMREVLRNDVW